MFHLNWAFAIYSMEMEALNIALSLVLRAYFARSSGPLYRLIGISTSICWTSIKFSLIVACKCISTVTYRMRVVLRFNNFVTLLFISRSRMSWDLYSRQAHSPILLRESAKGLFWDSKSSKKCICKRNTEFLQPGHEKVSSRHKSVKFQGCKEP